MSTDALVLRYFAGAAVGFVSVFLGIGGGILIVPLLIFVFHQPQKIATGTSLGIVAFIVVTGLAMDLVQMTEESRPAFLAAILIVPTSMWAARKVAPVIHRVPAHVLRRAFAVLVLIAAAKLFGLPPFARDAGASGLFLYRDAAPWALAILPVLGLVIGGISTLVGIGGGIVLIPSLGFLFQDLSWLECRATSLLVMTPTAFVGFARHLRQGTADPVTVRSMVPSSLAGALLGSWAAHQADATIFQRAFAAFLAVIALRLLVMQRRDD